MSNIATLQPSYSSRSTNGTTQYLSSASAQVPTAPPFTVMTKIIPAGSGVAISMMSSLTGGPWTGYYIPVGAINGTAAGCVSAVTANNNTFKFSSGATCSLGVPHIVTAVWASVASRQCFCDNIADTVETTSLTPGSTPNTFYVGASRHGGLVDAFCALTAIYWIYSWPFALSFADHMAVVNGLPPQLLYPNILTTSTAPFYFGFSASSSLGAGAQPPLLSTLAGTASPGLRPTIDGIYSRDIIKIKRNNTARRPPVPTTGAVFRRTLSSFGSRTGSRQVHRV